MVKATQHYCHEQPAYIFIEHKPTGWFSRNIDIPDSESRITTHSCPYCHKKLKIYEGDYVDEMDAKLLGYKPGYKPKRQ